MKRLLPAAALLVGAAYAQAPVMPPTPEAQALAQKLMAEINAGLQCSASVITLQHQLAAAQAKIKDLEAKTAPPKPAEQK